MPLAIRLQGGNPLVDPLEEERDVGPANDSGVIADFDIERCRAGEAECLGDRRDRPHEEPTALLEDQGFQDGPFGQRPTLQTLPPGDYACSLADYIISALPPNFCFLSYFFSSP